MLFYRHVTTINFGPVSTLDKEVVCCSFVLGSIPEEDSVPLMSAAFTCTNFTGHLLLLGVLGSSLAKDGIHPMCAWCFLGQTLHVLCCSCCP